MNNNLGYTVVVYPNDKCAVVRFETLYSLGPGRGYEDYHGRRCRICSRHATYEEARAAADRGTRSNFENAMGYNG